MKPLPMTGELISFDVTYSEDGLTRTTTTTFRDEETRTSYNDKDVYKSAMNKTAR